MIIKPSKENKLIIEFDKKLDPIVLLATARYIVEGIENYMLSDEYIEIINGLEQYIIPETTIQLLINKKSLI